jgi:hypothetical protein
MSASQKIGEMMYKDKQQESTANTDTSQANEPKSTADADVIDAQYKEHK